MIRAGTTPGCGKNSRRNRNQAADKQRKESQLKRRRIVRENYLHDRLLKMKRFPQISVSEPDEILFVLHVNREVQVERVTKSLNVFGARALAKHLLHGIARNDVRQHKYH